MLLALETVVYFEDKKGLILRVEDGQNAEAGELYFPIRFFTFKLVCQ